LADRRTIPLWTKRVAATGFIVFLLKGLVWVGIIVTAALAGR
jgi:hypothetical protein